MAEGEEETPPPPVAMPTHRLILDVFVAGVLLLDELVGQMHCHVGTVGIVRHAGEPDVALLIEGENPIFIGCKQGHVTSNVKFASFKQQRLGEVSMDTQK